MFSYGSYETVKKYVQGKAPDCNYNNAGKINIPFNLKQHCVNYNVIVLVQIFPWFKMQEREK